MFMPMHSIIVYYQDGTNENVAMSVFLVKKN